MPVYHVEYLATPERLKAAAGRMGAFSLTERDMAALLGLIEGVSATEEAFPARLSKGDPWLQPWQPTRVLEFGVNWGNTALFVLENVPSILQYVGVDLIPEKFPQRGIVPKEPGYLVKRSKHPSAWKFQTVQTDGTVEDLALKVGALGVKFDVIVMDADHDREPTQKDTEACEAFLAKPGLMVWHDYNVRDRQNAKSDVWGVRRYIDDLIAAGREIWIPDEDDRDPWRCCSIAWEFRR